MVWIRGHKPVWRVALLVLLLVAILGHWLFDRINVPAEYACGAPTIRLEGDFCGTPIPGTTVLFWIIASIMGPIVMLFTGELVLAQMGSELLVGIGIGLLVLLLLVLPFLLTLLSILPGYRQRQPVVRMVSWGLAVGVGLFLGLSNHPQMFWSLWGIWLYTTVAVCALTLELMALVNGRKTSNG